jgi:glyoxylase-like metal-dependent hydrolase (beta-lactamase superfamily II)
VENALIMQLFLLNNGFFTLDKSLVVYMKYMGQPYNAALKPLLVLTDNGEKVLVDTGAGELTDAQQKFFPVKRKEDQTLTTQLLKYGLKPEDIDFVINTHLHFDHCGNNRLFKNARFIVQQTELNYAYEPERFQQAAYTRDLFDVEGVNYEAVNGQNQVCKGISVLPTIGHSVGHQSVIIEGNNDRKYVYCGDAAPIRENLERRNIPGILYNAHEALEAIGRLRKIENAVYIFSHDNEQLTLQ